jgi:hypothetical protein
MVKRDKDYEAGRAVLREWDVWALNNEMEILRSLAFFSYVRKERPHLPKFEYPGDKWQCVRGWLLRAGKLKQASIAS